MFLCDTTFVIGDIPIKFELQTFCLKQHTYFESIHGCLYELEVYSLPSILMMIECYIFHIETK